MRRAILPIIALLSCAELAVAQRAWENGVWAKPMVVPNVGTPYRNYAIETNLIRLDLQETIAPGRPAIAAKVDSSVAFAIDGDMVYVKEGDAERALRLIKRAEKLRNYSAAGGGHFITVVASEGLRITLEDNSVWEIDPRGQFKSANWLVEQGISVRSIQEEDGFNYELSNTDADEAVLARLAR
jgi:hypothetical protein